MRDQKVKKSILAHNPTLGKYDDGHCLIIILLNFTKLSVEVWLIEI